MTDVLQSTPRFDIATRLLRRIDLSDVREEQMVRLMRDVGFGLANAGSGLSMREQAAFLVGSVGEFEARNLLSQVGAKDVPYGGEEPASVEFMLRVDAVLRDQAQRTGVPANEILTAELSEVLFDGVGQLCGELDVQLHPWVTPEGDVLLQWRRSGVDHVAVLYASEGWEGVRMQLETATRQEDLAYSRPILAAFIKCGTWATPM